ncbi:DUF6114 domain-containing protein [Nonomuraea sp. C10]|uniref:DUF6114 domain-containing protein n=1 Tax=Nonomuraea sp. C10 TaxID=2600577 RepID=UPI0011CE8C08|nr:DUF6114 domain-containing protein [Nonomuraea sp. C10]TXK34227.1 hypothetical protein FR742_33080 [Nonomuraea sp. C10]
MPDTRFRRWRRTRPFWGGLWVAAGGAVILLAPLAPLPLLVRQGVAGISGYLAGLLLVAAGLLSWWQHGQRVFLGVAAIALSLGSFVTSNLGGLGLGMLAGLTGGALLCAWSPDGRPARRREEPLRAIAAVPVALVLALPAPHPSGPADSGLEAARLTLWGGRFEGVVSRPAGPRLKLSMSAVEIEDGLHRTRGSDAAVHQRFSRLRLSGGVVMYVTRLRARVGGVALTFTPELPPPPLPLPSMTVTDVEADRLLVRAARARIEGLTQRVS